MEELGKLITWYMRQYGLNWQDAIKAIKADLKSIPEPVVLSGHFGT